MLEDNFLPRLRVLPLSLGPSCLTRKKTARKKGRAKSWGRDTRESPSFLSRHARQPVLFELTIIVNCQVPLNLPLSLILEH